MPRGPRADAPGTYHHVIVRGIEKRRIFADDLDREDLLRRISRIFPECDVTCFGWTFMPNHLHAVVRTGGVPLAVPMARLNTGYARYFNKRHDRVGHLFQNRYKAIPIFDDTHLLVCIRYVHLNPLRAGLVRDLESLARYPWTGHAVLMGNASASFQSKREVLILLAAGGAPKKRLASWMREAGPARGAEALCLRSLTEIVCAQFSVAPEELSAGRRTGPVVAARRALGFLANHRLGMNPPELAPILGVSRQAAAHAIGEGKGVVRECSGLSRLIKS